MMKIKYLGMVTILCFIPLSTGWGQSAVFPDPEWAVEIPEAHGLDSGKLQAAAQAASAIGGRRGFVVIEDGVIVHETYYISLDHQGKPVCD